MKIHKHIPNFLTSLNLLCGALAVFFAFHGALRIATMLIFAGAFFDFSDGFAARMFNAYSPMGKELDSLADMVSFGFAPMVILSRMIQQVIMEEKIVDFFQLTFINQILILSPFVITVFSGLRLAKFNVDTRQSESFIGLTTTATGLFLASLGYAFMQNDTFLKEMLQIQWVLVMFIPVFSFLLVSEIPMFSLKFKNYSLKENVDKYTLLIAGLFLIIWLGVGGIAVIISLYVIFSITKSLLKSR